MHHQNLEQHVKTPVVEQSWKARWIVTHKIHPPYLIPPPLPNNVPLQIHVQRLQKHHSDERKIRRRDFKASKLNCPATLLSVRFERSLLQNLSSPTRQTTGRPISYDGFFKDTTVFSAWVWAMGKALYLRVWLCWAVHRSLSLYCNQPFEGIGVRPST